MAASAACSNPHVFAHTLRFSARSFLALTKNAWFLEVPLSQALPLPSSTLFKGGAGVEYESKKEFGSVEYWLSFLVASYFKVCSGKLVIWKKFY